MRKLNKSGLLIVSVIMAGSMTAMSGCGASGEPASNIVEEQTVQVENSVPEASGTGEEAQSAETGTQTGTETETEAETETEIKADTETESEINTKTKADVGTDVGAEAETETKTKTETETKTETQAEDETGTKAEEQSQAVQEAIPAAEGSVKESDYAVIVKGVTIPLNGDMRNYTALLGDPDQFGSAKSCTEAGDDKVYTYGGTVIYTYIRNGADIISLIEIEGSESLPSGIHIGSTKAEVIAAYGSSYTQDGSELLYEMGNKTLGIQMNGETVSFIELFG